LPENTTSAPTSGPDSAATSAGSENSSHRVVSKVPALISGKILSKKKITVIGDSIMFDVKGYLEPEYPNMFIQCKVSFQIWHTRDAIQEIKKSRELGDIVIVELGTNGYCNHKTLYKIIDEIGNDRKIIFCTARIPANGEPAVNRNIRDVVKKMPKTVLADWYSVSAHHDEYFVKDGVHTTAAGSKAFAAMLQKAIAIAEN